MAQHAILMPNWLGDFVLALSVVERKRAVASHEMVLITPSHLVDLAQRLTTMQILEYRRETPDELKESVSRVKDLGAQVLYLMPYSFSSAWFGFRTGIARRRGRRGDFRSLLLTEALPSSIHNREVHITKEYSIIMEAQYADPQSWNGAAMESDPNYRDLVCFCPGANYGSAKRWGHFSELAALFSSEQICVLGGEDAQADAVHIEEAARGRVTNLAGRTSLVEAARILAGAKLVVSNDSGLMHVAGYLGKPVVGIFGSTSPVWTRPLGDRVRVAHKGVPCAPCFKRSCGPGHYECLNSITPQRVFDQSRELIGEPA